MRKFLSAAKLILTLRCEQSTRLVSDSLDRELSFAERWAVRLHYVGCWSCRRFGKQMRQLRDTITQYPRKTVEDEKLSDDALQRIKNAIQQDG